VLVERGSDRVVLTDFGIAAIHDSGTELVTRLTQQGERLGDPDYASPEQAAGEELTAATDVYSLGMIGIDMLHASGYDMSAADPRHSAASGAVTDQKVPTWLRELLERCLKKVPEHRPPASLVCSTLAAADANQDTTASETETDDDSLLDASLGFFAELRRRKVYRIAAAYGAGALVLIEFIDITGDALRIPEWLYRVVIAILLGGFPVAVTLSWMFDLTKRGVERTRQEDTSGPHKLLTALILPMAGLGLSIVLALLVGWWILRD
jgi:hypothetical protein